jgi:hypothetical protein
LTLFGLGYICTLKAEAVQDQFNPFRLLLIS